METTQRQQQWSSLCWTLSWRDISTQFTKYKKEIDFSCWLRDSHYSIQRAEKKTAKTRHLVDIIACHRNRRVKIVYWKQKRDEKTSKKTFSLTQTCRRQISKLFHFMQCHGHWKMRTSSLKRQKIIVKLWEWSQMSVASWINHVCRLSTNIFYHLRISTARLEAPKCLKTQNWVRIISNKKHTLRPPNMDKINSTQSHCFAFSTARVCIYSTQFQFPFQ